MSTVMSLNQTDVLAAETRQLKNVISALARQVMLQQFSQEEKLRSDGGSGIKQIRVDGDGPRTYFTNSHSGSSVVAIHDHANHQSTIGQGEGQFVLNGVEFRSRHNDYPLKMPSTKSSTYNLVSDIPFPEVPPDVLSKPTVEEQVAIENIWRPSLTIVHAPTPFWKELIQQTWDQDPRRRPTANQIGKKLLQYYEDLNQTA
ncbi:hypothetical protein Btru_070574 [Bulinus truncatus]|nr:hypothetical protein Btru_070574 [Bulinus truncatus]